MKNGTHEPRSKGLRGGAALALGLAIACGLTFPLAAQDVAQPDDTLPGFKANQVYQSSGVDNVNLYSGDTGIVVPIGPEYALSYGLKWQLKAYYSVKTWRMAQGCSAPDGNSLGPISWLAGSPELGAGWGLSLGYVTERHPVHSSVGETYHSPDGAEHRNFATAQPETCPSGTKCSNDGTQLRLRSSGSGWIVDFPDGSHHVFESYAVPSPPVNGTPDFYRDANLQDTPLPRWGLTSIVDKLGRTVLRVNYLSSDPARVDTIDLRPGTGEEARVTFVWTSMTINDGKQGVTWPVLSRIDMPSVSGTTPWTFTRDSAVIDRPGWCAAFSTVPSRVLAPLLRSIEALGRRYRFDYALPGADFAAMTTLTLPTGGSVSYSYGPTVEGPPNGSCDSARAPSSSAGARVPQTPSTDGGEAWWDRFTPYWDQSPGVTRREERLGTRVVGVTTYHRSHVRSQTPQGQPAGYRRTVVLDGDGFRIHYFSGTPDDTHAPGIELERKHYASTTSVPTACAAPYPDPAPLRTTVSCYVGLQANGSLLGPGCGYRPGQNDTYDAVSGDVYLQRTATWYGPPPANADGGSCDQDATTPCWQRAWSGFEVAARAFGSDSISANTQKLLPSVRRRRTDSTLAPAVDETRWRLRETISKSVKDDYAENPSDPLCPADSAPCQGFTSYSWDASTGLLKRALVFDYEATGTLTRASTFNLDGATDSFLEFLYGTGLVEDRPVDELTTQRAFTKSGLLLTSKRDPDGSNTWFSHDVSRSPRTGVVTSSRDPNGLATAYAYDGLGRLTGVTPPGGEATTTYCYQEDSSTWGPYVLVKKGMPGACDTSLGNLPSGTMEAFQFDGLGRLIRQVKALPNPVSGNKYSVQETAYDAAGHRSFLSEWASCGGSSAFITSCMTARLGLPSLTQGTTWSQFDYLGRPRQIDLADGTSIQKQYVDEDGRDTDFGEVTITAGVKVNGVSTTLRSAVFKDVLGRVRTVSEPHAFTPGAPFTLKSTYTYNVLDKLTTVNVMGAGTQTRRFDYSGIGLLLRETHPEKGTTTYSLYDALGNVRRKTEGGHEYTTTYDKRGRPLVSSVLTAQGVEETYAEHTYDGNQSTGGGYVKGKLTQRVGHNTGSMTNERVTESFTYSGMGGRLSSKTTTIAPGGSFVQSWDYNSLGLPSRYDHPRSNGTLYSEWLSYSAGLPVSSTADGSNVVLGATYNAAGGLASYQTANGVTTTIVPDASLMPRPAQITARRGWTTLFDTGTYSYDAAGNITAVGADQYRYDSRSRLTYAGYSTGDSDGYSYDDFGNILSWTRNGSTFSFQVDSATNRTAPLGDWDSLGNLKRYGTQTFAYDRFSRLVSVGPNPAETYGYDAAGERVVKNPPAAGGPLCLASFTLPGGRPNSAYAASGLSVSGGTPPYTWSLPTRPAWLSVVPTGSGYAQASLTGTPTASGSFPVVVQVVDSTGKTVSTVTSSIEVFDGLELYALPPCRLIDTRDLGAPYGGPRLDTLGAYSRTFTAHSLCDVPATAAAIVTNLTVTGSQALGGRPNIKAFADGAPVPRAWATTFLPGYDRAASGVIALSSQGAFKLQLELDNPGSASTHVILDVSGYFAGPPSRLVPSACSTSGPQTPITYTLRDEANRVRSEFSGSLLKRDDFYLGNLLVASKLATGWEYYSHDHLGTIRLVTDAAGGSIATPRYRAFGTVLGGNSTFAQRFGLAGMETETPSGTLADERYNDHARVVSAYRGRFSSVDPEVGKVGDPQSWNRYAYAVNNPLSNVDPDGRQTLKRESGDPSPTPPPPPTITPAADPASWLKDLFRSLASPDHKGTDLSGPRERQKALRETGEASTGEMDSVAPGQKVKDGFAEATGALTDAAVDTAMDKAKESVPVIPSQAPNGTKTLEVPLLGIKFVQRPNGQVEVTDSKGEGTLILREAREGPRPKVP